MLTPGREPMDRRGLLQAVGLTAILAACGRSRPSSTGAPGDPAGPPIDQTDVLAATNPVYVADARAFLVKVPESARGRALRLLPPDLAEGVNAGLLALAQRCPAYDGCALEFCSSSAWFECPCCGGQFDQLGAKHAGPAPRGMSMFAIRIVNGSVRVVPDPAISGLPIGTVLVSQQAAGPHCH